MKILNWTFSVANSYTSIFFFTILFGIIYFGFSLQVAEADVNNPDEYRIQSYTYHPALGLYFSNGIPDIYNLDTIAITYYKESNMDIVAPAEVSEIFAELFFINGGVSQFEYKFYDDSINIPPAPYTWTKSGEYEVDVYGIADSSTAIERLTTMRFTVNIDGGPLPTCDMTATPNTIVSKDGEKALIEWSSSGADTATFNQGIGSVDTSGSFEVSPSATTTYTANFAGTYGSVDCSVTINVPDPIVFSLHEKAANLAKQLVNRPDAYLWGGKGWDYDLAQFTSPERILSGYTYFNPDTSSKETGIGVDCSGLITWAFNRAHDAATGFASNYIKYVNADGMFRDQQSSAVTEAELEPGDTLTFDWNGDGRMDHVAMYVGESSGYDVVDATSPDIGIRERINSTFKSVPGFSGYRRIHQADAPLVIKTGSPVDMKVTDPDGDVISASILFSSDEEYIREIPGELYYLELEQGHDGRPEDIILSPHIKDGSYQIEIIPEPNANLTDTYSLSFEINGVETVVVNNETIDKLPENGFTLKLQDGEIEGVDSTIKILLEELRTTINGLTISSASRKRNLLSAIETAVSWFDKNRTDQIIRKLTKVQNDINRHLTNDLTPEELANINQQIEHLLVLLNS